MFETIKTTLKHLFTAIVLRGYGWRPRRTIYRGKSTQQWRNPYWSVWVPERVAARLLRIQLLDEYEHR